MPLRFQRNADSSSICQIPSKLPTPVLRLKLRQSDRQHPLFVQLRSIYSQLSAFRLRQSSGQLFCSFDLVKCGHHFPLSSFAVLRIAFRLAISDKATNSFCFYCHDVWKARSCSFALRHSVRRQSRLTSASLGRTMSSGRCSGTVAKASCEGLVDNPSEACQFLTVLSFLSITGG